MAQAVLKNSNEIDRRKARRAAILRHIRAAKVALGENPPAEMVKVKALQPSTSIPQIELLVLRRYPRRQIDSVNYRGPVAAACGRDETGVVGLVLWGDQVDKVRTGDVIRITDGWCRRSHGELVVSSGKRGKLSLVRA